MPIIAVVGGTKSGRTTILETMIQGLTKKGYRVAIARELHEAKLNVDAREKVSLVGLPEGVKAVISMKTNELAIVKKIDTTKYHLNDLAKNVSEAESDVLILDGFGKLVSKDLLVPKIAFVRTTREVNYLSRNFQPILCFTTLGKLNITDLKIPNIDALREPKRLIETIENRISPIIEKRRSSPQNLEIQVNEKIVPLNPFVHKCIRNVVLAMISTLKGTAIRGDEDISIEIQQQRGDTPE